MTATTSSAPRAERLRALGADHIVDRSSSAESDLPLFDVIVDTVAGPELGSKFALLRPNGRYVLCGGVGGAPAADFGTGMLEVFHRSPTFIAFSLNSVDHATVVEAGAQMFSDAERGELTPLIHRELPLADAASAHVELEEGRAFGKIVLIP